MHVEQTTCKLWALKYDFRRHQPPCCTNNRQSAHALRHQTPCIPNQPKASLETVKTKKGDFQLLNCDDHRRLVTKKSGKDPKDLRPDIVHQVNNQSTSAVASRARRPALVSCFFSFFPAGYLCRTNKSAGVSKSSCLGVLNSSTAAWRYHVLLMVQGLSTTPGLTTLLAPRILFVVPCM